MSTFSTRWHLYYKCTQLDAHGDVLRCHVARAAPNNVLLQGICHFLVVIWSIWLLAAALSTSCDHVRLQPWDVEQMPDVLTLSHGHSEA